MSVKNHSQLHGLLALAARKLSFDQFALNHHVDLAPSGTRSVAKILNAEI
jgi:hypothetical protein